MGERDWDASYFKRGPSERHDDTPSRPVTGRQQPIDIPTGRRRTEESWRGGATPIPGPRFHRSIEAPGLTSEEELSQLEPRSVIGEPVSRDEKLYCLGLWNMTNSSAIHAEYSVGASHQGTPATGTYLLLAFAHRPASPGQVT
jgi:hypothetical protein